MGKRLVLVFALVVPFLMAQSSLTDFPNGVASYGIPIVGSGDVLTTGRIFFVDSSTSTSNTRSGAGTRDKPFSRLQTALEHVRAGRGDYVLVMPSHAETISAAGGIDFSGTGVTATGVTVRCLGNGRNRPTFTFGTAVTADIDIDAGNVTIRNCVFDLTGVDAVAAAIDVNAADFTFENNEIIMADAGDQALVAIDLAVTADRARIQSNVFHSVVAGATEAISISGAANNIAVVDNTIVGTFSDAAIDSGSVFVNGTVSSNNIVNAHVNGRAIRFSAASTGVIRQNAMRTNDEANSLDPGSMLVASNYFQDSDWGDINAIEVPGNLIGSDDTNNAAATTNIAANPDGSLLERNEQNLVNEAAILALIGRDGGLAYNGTVDAAAAGSTTIHPIDDLIGLGDDFFNTMYDMCIVLNDGTPGGAPETECQDITDFANATGTVTTAAFTGLVQAGDEVIIRYHSIAAIGENSANNVFDSSAVVANSNGSELERLEDLDVNVGAPAGASVSADIAAVDVDTSALLIDTGDGADAEVLPGVAGSLHAHIREAQEDLGDGVDVVVAPGVAGSLHGHLREAQEQADLIQTDTTALLVDTGDGADAEVLPGVAGSLHAHVREAQEDLGDGADAIVAAGVAGSLHGHVREIQEDTGAGTDAAVAPAVAGSLHSHLREAQEQADSIQTDTAALLVDTGDGTDAEVLPGVAGSIHAHVREVQEDLGDGTDGAVAAGVAGSVHAHIRSAQQSLNTINVNAGLAYQGIVDVAAPGSLTVHPSANLGSLGNGDDYLNTGYAACVLLNTSAPGTAPERECRDITDYASATGTITTVAFTMNVEASDELLVIHESQLVIGEANADNTYDSSAVVANSNGSGMERLEDLDVNIGAPAGASVSADIAAVDVDTSALLVDAGDGTDAIVAPGVAGSLHAHLRETQEQADLIQTDTTALLVDTGDGADAIVAAGVAGSLHGHVREIQEDTGAGTDAAVAPAVAGSLHGHLREAQEQADSIQTDTAALLVDTGDGTDATVAPGVAGSLHGHIREIQNDIGAPDVSIANEFLTLDTYNRFATLHNTAANPAIISVDVDFTNGTWNTVATHEVFTVTGDVRVRCVFTVSETLTDAGNLAVISFGNQSLSTSWIGGTGAAGSGGNTLDAGELWFDNTPTDVDSTTTTASFDRIVAGGRDLGYEITGEVIADGTMNFTCFGTNITAGSSIAAGAGGVL